MADELDKLRQELQRKQEQDAAAHREDVSADQAAAWLTAQRGERCRFSAVGPGGAVLEVVGQLRELQDPAQVVDDCASVARSPGEAREIYLLSGWLHLDFPDGCGLRIRPMSWDDAS